MLPGPARCFKSGRPESCPKDPCPHLLLPLIHLLFVLFSFFLDLTASLQNSALPGYVPEVGSSCQAAPAVLPVSVLAISYPFPICPYPIAAFAASTDGLSSSTWHSWLQLHHQGSLALAKCTPVTATPSFFSDRIEKCFPCRIGILLWQKLSQLLYAETTLPLCFLRRINSSWAAEGLSCSFFTELIIYSTRSLLFRLCIF